MILFSAAARPQASYWPVPFRTALAQRGVRPRLFLQVALPDGTTLRLSDGELPSTGLGPCTARVARWGSIDRGVSRSDGHLGAIQMSIELDDTPDRDGSRTWSTIITRFGNRLRGAAASVRWLVAGLPLEQCPPEYSGLVYNWPQSSEFAYTLELRPPDTTLRNGKIPQQLISASDYPRAKPDVISKPFPLAYGTYSSLGFTAKGLLPTYRVDGVNFYYLVCLGRITIRTVYNAGVVVPTSAYTVSYRRGGKTVTELKFTADPGETAAITVDVDGYDDIGDGTGLMISNPVRQAQHLLENFVFGNWTSGPWLKGVAPLDARTWDVAAWKLQRRGYQGAYWLGGDRKKPSDLVNQFCEATGLLSWWTAEGKIAVGLLDPLDERCYLDSPWLMGSSQDDGRFARPLAVDQLTRRLTAQYAQNPGNGEYLQSLAVMDHTMTERSELERQNPWAAVQV